MGRWTRRSGRRLLLAASLVLALLEIPGAVELLRRPDPQIQLRHLTVMVADPAGPGGLAGVRAGDELFAIDGTRVHSRADFQAGLQRRQGDLSRWTVLRGTGRMDFTVHLPIEMTTRPFRDLVPSLTSLCFLFLGFITYLRRDDALGRNFHICCLCFAAAFSSPPATASIPLARLTEGLRDVAVLLLPLYLLRFVLLFPEGIVDGHGQRPLLRRILWPAVVLGPAHLLGALFPDHPAAIALVGPLLLVTALVFGVALASTMVVFLRKARGSRDWAYGSRMRLAGWGLILGFGPLLLTTLGKQFVPNQELAMEGLALLALPLVPASLSMALLRSGSIDLAYLLRQSLVTPLLPGHLHAAAYLLLLALIPAAALFAHLPARWIDRVLYPEQARVREVSSRLGKALAQERDPGAVISIFLDGINEIAQANNAAFYSPGSKGWIRKAGDTRYPEVLAAESVLGRQLSRGAEMIRCRDIEAQLDEAGRRWLEQTDVRVAGRLLVHSEALGLVCAGPRSHGRSYGPLQLFHLGSLARQAAQALENAMLHEEDLQRERVSTELDLAAEIQARLLPEEDLRAGSMDIAGRTLSCRQIGGDLYDHFVLSDGRVVVAVSDAAGKGIPASLLISGLRTAVRETIRPGLALGEAMASINRHVHGMTSTGHFIAVFAAILDPRDGVMEYCVAGAEPALWVRSNQRNEWLNRGGPVLGVDPQANYPCGIVRLSPGDMVIPYSDGVIDEENADEEPFGRNGLVDSVNSSLATSSAGVLAHILSQVQAHAAGSEAVDDTTLVVIRRLREAGGGMVDAVGTVDAQDRREAVQ